MDMVHETPLGVSHPVQLPNVDPAAAAAVRVIDVPLATVSVQSVPQLMPIPVTVPDPVPFFATVSVYVTAALLNFAVTDLHATIDIVHEAPLGEALPARLPRV